LVVENIGERNMQCHLSTVNANYLHIFNEREIIRYHGNIIMQENSIIKAGMERVQNIHH
jgi:hypothetical protein